MILRNVRQVAVALATITMLPAPAGPAAASPHPDPGVIRLVPAPGEVVDVGPTVISGILFSSAPISDVNVLFRGVAYRPELRPLDGHNQRFSVEADVPVGSHVAEVSFVADGQRAQRRWRFAGAETSIRRLAGADRVATAVAMSQDSFPEPESATGAVIATGWDFPDALAAAPVARAVGGPLLLTAADELSDATAAELQRVLAPDATVILMGGPSALEPAVADDVETLGFAVRRIDGRTRADTAARAATTYLGSSTVLVTASHTFADALSAAAPAARDGMPILLTARTELSPETRAYLEANEIERAVVVGGEQAVADEVVTQLDAIVPDVERIAGADRFGTALGVLSRFYGSVDGVSIANGLGFADALAGGAHAAASGRPLVLARPTGLTEATVQRLTQLGVTAADLYGGHVALDGRVDRGVRRAAYNRPDGARVVEVTPRAAQRVSDVDTVQVRFDREVQPASTLVYATIDGREWHGTLGHGDFADTVVFRVGDLPIPPDRGIDHDVDVWVLTFDGTSWHHLHWHFLLHRLDIGRGDSGADVSEVQARLHALGYWLPRIDGHYGASTAQAVMAFQKWEGLPRTGTADRVTVDRLLNARRPTPRAPRDGRWVEIDKTRQVMLFNLNGAVQWAMNTSTGTETSYRRPDGSTGFAHTPEGWFTFFRQIDGMREADLGQMWRPKYFTNAGHAIHGSTSVPSYPASHGCARLSYPGIDFVWSAGLAPIGTPLYVYR